LCSYSCSWCRVDVVVRELVRILYMGYLWEYEVLKRE
jgi:hypothetical protein